MGYTDPSMKPFPVLFAVAAAAAALAAPSAAADTVPTPTVTGPLAAVAPGDPSRDYPFFAAVVDLKAQGYVEEEFFIEGTANRYNTPGLATGSVVDRNHRYKTRLLVRRPASAVRFNGTVIVEWNNVTAGRDLDIDWFQTHEHLMRSGYAWVGVTPQRVGVEALKVWSPKRYGTLDVTAGGTIDGDALSYDVFAQAAQAVRTSGSANVMGGLKVERVFATGHSQSAGRLATYVNSVHPLATVFDAVVLHGGGGRVRTDLDIPVWKLLAETDVLGTQAANRQPDTARFRSWEVAGTSHVDLQFVSYSRQLSVRDGSPVAPGANGGRRGATPAGRAASSGGGALAAAAPQTSAAGNPGGCDRPPYSHIPFHYVMNAAFDHLVRWVRDGVAPPTATPIETTAVGPPAIAARDARGNALGGIRLSQHAVPTAVNTGQNSGPGFCRLNGSHEPFDAATLASLYPTHAAYVAAVREATGRNLQAGYILQAAAEATIAAAEAANIGKR
jgi:Alpha/beta hydrolase domain